jgi:hypothetical protein
MYNKFIFLLQQNLSMPLAGTYREITDSFSNSQSQNSYETIMQWAIVAGAIIFVFGLITLIRTIFWRRQAFIPAGWITAPRMLRNLLNDALIQRSTFEVQFTDKAQNDHPIMRCSLDNFSSGRMSLLVYGVSNIAYSWIGRGVDCYFRINVKDQSVYYTFNSIITETENKPRGLTILWVKIPERLQNRQKRAFLRLNPPSELLIGSAVWYGQNLPAEDKLDSVSTWVKPNLALLPNRDPQFYIKDLSAGGLRLSIPNNHSNDTTDATDTTDAADEFSVAENIIILLDLRDPDSEKKIRFWFKCRIQNVMSEHNSKTTELGMQIIAWATPKEGGANLEWLRLTRENEVAPLGNWIVRRHLEQFRTNPE